MKKDFKQIFVKDCPVCGVSPNIAICDLGRPGGRGYPGHNTYQYLCPRCGLLKSGDVSDIYISQEEAINLAKELWNEKVDMTQKHIDRVYTKKV